MSILKELKESGFYRIEENYSEILNESYEYVKNAGSNNENSFAAYPSFLNVNKKNSNINSLNIDIGGTSTKAAIKLNNQWHFLFEIRNIDSDKLKGSDNANGIFNSFIKLIVNTVEAKFTELNINKDSINAISVVWSNPIENYQIDNSIVSGKIAGKELYLKGEWFIEDLNNGDDIGKAFIDNFKIMDLILLILLYVTILH